MSNPQNPNYDGAFPFVSQGGLGEHQVFFPGLTKREYMATKILAGLLAGGNTLSEHDLALCAVASADALLQALRERDDG